MHCGVLLPLIIVLVLAGSARAQENLRLEFTASTTSPYVGQVVELRLSIKGKPTEQSPLLAPWLTATDTRWNWWESLESWRRRYSVKQDKAVTLQWQGQPLYVPEAAPGEYVLLWKIVPQAPVETNDLALRVAGVQVGSVQSRPLVLELRRPPPLPSGAGVWTLGVGQYAIQAAWQKAGAVLGQDLGLAITVTGQGDLASLPAPSLVTMPGWDRNTLLLEPIPEPWREGTTERVFRYHLRPRRLGTLTPPGILTRWFDPDSGTIQTQLVKIPPLQVAASAEAATTPGPSRAYTVEDAWKALPTSVKKDLRPKVLGDLRWWSELVLWLPVVCLVPIVGRGWIQRYRPAWWLSERRRKAARKAWRRVERAGNQFTPTEGRMVLADWLSTITERGIAPEFDHLHATLQDSPLGVRFLPLLGDIQEWEFGPYYPQQREQVSNHACRLFQQTEAEI
jgi:hypothetical protein